MNVRDETVTLAELHEQVRDCREKAAAALDAGSSVGAREWYEAASAAMSLIRQIEAGGR